MAKSGKTKDGKKKAALKVPKSVAGVKVPKKVRKAADPVLRAVENPIVAEIAAAALVAAAGALAARKAPKVKAVKDKVAQTGDTLKDALSSLANDMADKALAALEGIEEQVKSRKAASGRASAETATDS